MATQTIKIDIVSDTVCPWCFIGKRRLEKAMQQFKATNPSVTFDVEWHPFQLNPTMSKENPIPKLVNYRRKFGEERTNEFIPYMKGIGQAEGIQFAFDGLTSNTLDSHRLIHWAKQFGKQNELVEELFKDYFERDRNIGDNQVLAEAAGRVGLDQAQALAYLNSDQDVALVQEAVEESKRKNINGVPDFTIQKRFTFPGAQEVGTFIHFFEKALADKSSTNSL